MVGFCVCIWVCVCVRAHIIWFAISFFCSSRILSFLISFSMRLCDLSFSYESYAVSSRLAGSGDDQQAGRQAGRRDHTYRQARQIRVVSCGADHRQAHAHVASSSAVLARRQKAEDASKIVERLDWMDLSCGFRGLRCPILQTHTHHNKQQKN